VSAYSYAHRGAILEINLHHLLTTAMQHQGKGKIYRVLSN